MPRTFPRPLGGPAPAEVRLARSPLVRVLGQVRFSSVLRIDTKEGVTAFQESIRSDYPLFEPLSSHQTQLELGPHGPSLRSIPATVWRFGDAAQTVQLSLTTDSVTLEALTYEGRDRFLERWTEVLARIEAEFAPGLALRAGLRYVNRLHDQDAIARLPELVSPSFIGVAQPDLREFVFQALSEASIEVEEGRLTLRWGILPPNATTDPILLAPVANTSWVFDLDVFSEERQTFSGQEIGQLFRRLSERAYAVFRYAVTPAGIAFFGA